MVMMIGGNECGLGDDFHLYFTKTMALDLNNPKERCLSKWLHASAVDEGDGTSNMEEQNPKNPDESPATVFL